VLFETEPEFSFAILDPAGTEKTIATPDGGLRVVTTPILNFINTQTLSLWNFLNIDIASWINEYIILEKLNYRQIGGKSKSIFIGTKLFKKINNLV